MWKGPMKCPLVGHSFKWDKQAVQIYEMIRVGKGKEDRKAHPNLGCCHLLSRPRQGTSYCGLNRTKTSPDMALYHDHTEFLPHLE